MLDRNRPQLRSDEQRPQENPFAPPTTRTTVEQTTAVSMPRDADYIPAIGRLKLPAMCVVTGTTQSLVQREVTLRVYPVAAILAMILCWVLSTMACLDSMFQGRLRLRSAADIYGLIATGGLIALTIFLSYVSSRRASSVTVRWYVSANLQRRFQITCLAYAGVISFVAVLIWVASKGELRVASILLFITAIYALWLMIRGMQCLSVAGRKDGMVLIAGVSEKVRNIMKGDSDDREAGDSEANRGSVW